MSATALDGQPPHILIVEDDLSLAKLVSIFLRKKGYRVTAVADGEAALEALAHGDVDLGLLDVMMPRKTGFEVLAILRARGDATPIIMATAVANAEQIAHALESGADDYVTKPYALSVLAARVALRLKARPAAKPPGVPAAHTADFPIALARDGEVELDVDDDAIVASQRSPGVTVASEERSFLARLRAAAEQLKKKPRDRVTELAIGARLADRYELKRKIGEGGFGVVFEARHVDLGQSVAVKLLRPGRTESSLQAFRREAQRASAVRHDHAVRVLDFGEERGVAYFVMELLDGPTVEDVVAQHGALEVARATTIARAVLSALTAAHALGIVHRDVKPQNIIIHRERDREVPKLLDFGIAKSMTEADAVGVLVGSAPYIAPERLQSLPYDGRADVYALGVVLFRMLTGNLPFAYDGEDLDAIAQFHLHEQVPKPSLLRPGLSPTVDQVVLRLMEKTPERRPAAEEAAALVEQLVWEASLG